jgi:hypothetical protein
MNTRIKSYQGLSEALADQALLGSNGIRADLENSQDIHPSLLGQVFLSVPPDELEKALSILKMKDQEDPEESK